MKKFLLGATFLASFAMSLNDTPSSCSNMYSYTKKPTSQARIESPDWRGILTIGKDTPKQHFVTVHNEGDVLQAMAEDDANSANLTDENGTNQFLVTRDGDMLTSIQLFGDLKNRENKDYQDLLNKFYKSN